MKRTRIAAVGLAVFAFGTMSWIATAFVPMVEHAPPPQKVAEEGGCLFPIASTDGTWTACVDGFGQVVDFVIPGIPGDNVFETLLYDTAGGLSRRVELNYIVAAGPIVSAGGDSTWTRLTKVGGGLSIEITNRMINGPAGGGDLFHLEPMATKLDHLERSRVAVVSLEGEVDQQDVEAEESKHWPSAHQ